MSRRRSRMGAVVKGHFFWGAMMACPCCGYRTVEDAYQICAVCFWENDPTQTDDQITGANRVSLREGQRNFREVGACEARFLKMVRGPSASEARDPAWRMLEG